MMLFIFIMLTIAMAFGLFKANAAGVPALPMVEQPETVSFGQALYHMLTASKILLSGLEAMSNGIQR
jgi:hypothetical protein